MYDQAEPKSNFQTTLRAAFASGRTRSLDWRIAQLKGMIRFCKEAEGEIAAALKADLGKSLAESLTTEVVMVVGEAEHALKNLKKWTAPEKVPTPFVVQPGHSLIAREPLGVVLIIGAWNLPIAVCLAPLVAALAAGNAILLKPSEMAAATSKLMAEVLPKYLDPEAVRIVEGGADVTQALLNERWDHIFYTGGGIVGRKIAVAAAQNLTPVTLELGGKNPAYIHKSADLKVTARRMVWAKWMNAGQVCVSPDYALVDTEIVEAFTEQLKAAIKQFYGSDPLKSADYARIISDKHFTRIKELIEGSGGQVLIKGDIDAASRGIGPTVILNPKADSAIMSDEIFGPVLPILTVSGPEDAALRMSRLAIPLVVHTFAQDKEVTAQMQGLTRSGAYIVNDAVINHSVRGLPFGGQGESGMGVYHGRHGFETFTHRRAILNRPTMLDNDLRYPPYTDAKLKQLRMLTGL
jgi:aldehyde dehydrogenase (NAD+)